MPTPPGAAAGAPRPPLRRLTFPLRVAGVSLCALVLVVAAVGVAGGLEEAPDEALPVAPVDEFYDGEPWRVRVSGAGLFPYDEDDPVRPRDERNHLLVLSADVEVTAQETRGGVSEVLYVEGIDGLGVRDDLPWTSLIGEHVIPPDELRLLRDGTTVYSLHPGLPERVLFFWERSADAGPAPAEIEVVITGMTFRESSLTGRMEWLDHEPRARVVVPLRDLRDAERDQ